MEFVVFETTERSDSLILKSKIKNYPDNFKVDDVI